MPVPPLNAGQMSVTRKLRIDPAKVRVFVCDDDLDFAAEMVSALTASGFEARTLKDGKTPVEIFELFAPDVVLLDLNMPPPDGYEIVNHIVQNTTARAVSVAILSGADDRTLEIANSFCKGRGLKPVAVLQKPVRLSDVLTVCFSHHRQDRVTA